MASGSACFRLCPSLDLECPRTPSTPLTPTLPRTLQPHGPGGTRSPVNRRERMQLSGATGSQGVPIPHPLGWEGGRAQGGETDLRDTAH